MAALLSCAARRDLETNVRLKYALSTVNKTRCVNYSAYKPKQAECLKLLSEGKDVIACLRTGYGKSLIFESLPYVTDTKNATILVVNPLNSIITEQLARYGDKAINISKDICDFLKNSVCESDCNCESCKFWRCEFVYVIGHPEHFLNKKTFDIFKNESWQSCVTHIVVDEAHCIEKWGKDFRRDYRELSKLRSAFPSAHVLALTGTATSKTCSSIAKYIALKNINIVKTSVSRTNVKLSVVRRPPQNTLESFQEVIGPYIKDLRRRHKLFPKTVIYSKLKWVAAGYQLSMMPEDGSEVSDAMKKTVAQYHASCTEKLKEKVVEEMSGQSIRLLFATEAYSMGTDAQDVRKVIHFGVPTSLETYLQEVGRAGRDGYPSEATMYFNRYDIGQNTYIEQEVRDYILTTKCRWEYISEYFDSYCEKNGLEHDCCDVCEKTCTCELCEETKAENIQPATKTRRKMQKQNAVLSALLTQYIDAENQEIGLPLNIPKTGLTEKLVKAVIKDTTCYSSKDKVLEKFPHMDHVYANNIALIVQHCESSH